MPPQYDDSVLQTPPPRPTLRVADSPTGSSLQEHTHGGAASGHDEGCPPGFGPAGPTVNVVPPSTPPVDDFADRLELFVNKVTSKIASPLIREPPKQLSVKVMLPPRRSKRQAAQSLSRVPASKRGEILVMQRLGLATAGATPSASAVKAYEDLYKPDTSNAKALAALFNDDIGNESVPAEAEAQAGFLG
ncbi:hypothetical protein PVAP13_3NG249553 [Panicum virgatum]|uniref:Uncharacterized protein n=1 Tax=Panicum virgatum TaxID=38727 RepID=A0A8T0U6M7_PANVG|nr:hypothetical protein PVAP13_3NG249553 [Panicum virgatum]